MINKELGSVVNILQSIRLADLDSIDELTVTVKDLVVLANHIDELSIVMNKQLGTICKLDDRLDSLIGQSMQLLDNCPKHIIDIKA